MIHTKKKLLKQVALPKDVKFSVAVQLKNTILTLNKPINVGMNILELSKCVMYVHHYQYVMKKYDFTRAKLMMTDTDSLLY